MHANSVIDSPEPLPAAARILVGVRHWRRHLGPPDWIIAGLLVFILGVLIGGTYLLAVWGIGSIWKEQDRQQGTGFGFAGVAIRQPDGSITFHLATMSDAFEFLDQNTPPPGDTMLVNYAVADAIESRWWDVWAASGRVESLKFYVLPTPRANGGPLAANEELRILQALQRDHPEALSPALRNAASLSARSLLAESVYHNTARGIATLLAVGGFLWGALWLTRVERRYRQWFLGKCAACGYPLRDIRGDRCPECGTRWWAYGDDIANG